LAQTREPGLLFADRLSSINLINRLAGRTALASKTPPFSVLNPPLVCAKYHCLVSSATSGFSGEGQEFQNNILQYTVCRILVISPMHIGLPP
jgi:hypothetical protein